MSNTLIINLIAGPCSGKSTISAELFARLKKMGIKCELVPEFIKEEIYKENKTIINRQITIFGNQYYSIINKLGKVDCIIEDGSFINNIIYNCEDNPEFNALVISEYKKLNNLTFFIDRGTIPFETYGRIHDKEQSYELDNKIKEVFDRYDCEYIIVESRDAVDKIVPIVLKRLEEIK